MSEAKSANQWAAELLAGDGGSGDQAEGYFSPPASGISLAVSAVPDLVAAESRVGPPSDEEILAEQRAGHEARRKIALAQSEQVITELNERFFVSQECGRVRIFSEQIDAETQLPALAMLSQPEFDLLLKNRLVHVPLSNGQSRAVPLSKAWLLSPNRREYLGGLAMLPGQATPAGVYNLYKGFGVEAKPGRASPILRHLRDVICAGQIELFHYLLRWCAHAVQRPGEPTEVAVVLRGDQGTGKGTAAALMMRIFGTHALQVNSPRHVTGNFNAHLRRLCFLFVDEAFFAGDRGASDVLKGLITEPYITIEPKGVDAFSVRNRLKIMMASNSSWVVPAGSEERRYFVVDVSDARRQDHAYFERLRDCMDSGGVEAFLNFLLKIDISHFNIRSIPASTALDQQKLQTLDPLMTWLYDRLCQGTWFDHAGAWQSENTCSLIAGAYEDYASRRGLRYERTDATSLGGRLRTIFPELVRKRSGTKLNRKWVWVFPPLVQARADFARVAGLRSITWPAQED